jgi:hypothetical protein
MKKRFLSFLLSVSLLANLFANFSVAYSANDHLVINEIMYGQNDATKNEFIELYNPTNSSIDVTGYTLKKLPKPSTTTILIVERKKDNLVSSFKCVEPVNCIIPAGGYFLISHPDYQVAIGADLVYSNISNSIANNNTIFLYNQNKELVDKVGWGMATEIENQPAIDFADGQSIERALGVDTDNNLLDFKINQTPSPKNNSGQVIVVTEVVEVPVVSNYLENDITINEVVMDPVSGENEWIELYSSLGSDTDLKDWTIEDGKGTILILSGVIIKNDFLVFEISSAKLNNDGDLIILKSPNGGEVDRVAYGNWDDGKTDDNAPTVSDPLSIIRTQDGMDTKVDSVDFVVSKNSTKGSLNNISVQPNISTTINSSSNTNTVLPGAVVINEIMADPEEEEEWVELYNKTNKKIDLAGWSLVEGSEATTEIEGVIEANGFLVIEQIKGNLNNSGDIINLVNDNEKIIDTVSYGNWNDGNIVNNAPKASDPNSLSRKENGQDTNNNSQDFVVSPEVTKGEENILLEKTVLDKDIFLKNKLIISEIYPNPTGPDMGEFIELQNISQENIDIAGIKLSDNSSRKYALEGNIILKPLEYYVVKREQSKIALNNSGGDKMILYDKFENIIDQVSYVDSALEGYSYSLVNKSWNWSEDITQGTENKINKTNRPPVIKIDFPKSELLIHEKIILDSSDSYDPDGDLIIKEWRVGDNLFHDDILTLAFDKVGNQKIDLMISDGVLTSFETITLNVGAQNLVPISRGEINLELINEVAPNPTGSDQAEFIELYNNNAIEIDLSGYYLDDIDGGSKPYQFMNNFGIQPFSYLVLKKEETKLSLNNESDSIRLLDDKQKLLQQIDYDNAEEGVSYSRSNDGGWYWTEKISAGEENQITISPEIKKSKNSKIQTGVFEVLIEDVKELAVGENIITRGVVAVKPEILGVQFFYVVSETNKSIGIQIYNYKKDFPELSIGDLVEVSGVLSQSGGEYRLKTKQKDDIKVIANQTEIIASQTKIIEIEDKMVGGLSAVSGEVIEIKGSTIYLDDSTGEVQIYLKRATGIDKSNIREGDTLEATGILTQTSNGYKLSPRFQDDLKTVKVLGVESEFKSVDSDIIIEPKNYDWLKYVAVTLGGLIVLIGVFGARYFRKK